MSKESCEHHCDQNPEQCGQNCNNCSEKKSKSDFMEKPHEMSQIRKVIGIVSGKGGVGKSMVTSLLAIAMSKRGFHTAILDADITGPSIPKAFGVTEKIRQTESGIFPSTTEGGIQIMSVNLILPRETDAVVWRGPILANTVKQFWKDVIWGPIDYMFVDMPPGTGDIPLTVFQSLPLDGIIIVTSPQELVSMIVSKAVNMAELMQIPILGIIENMSYFKCPDNGKEYKIFGESHLEEISKLHKISILGRLPIDPKLSLACDKGAIEKVEDGQLSSAAGFLETLTGHCR